jgi:putative transposase
MVVGFMYLVAIMDWFSRYIVALAVSNPLDVGFCLEALEQALPTQAPEIFNSDQGMQFTSEAWIDRIEAAGSAVSMDGRGRVFDNIFIEQL